MIFSTGNPASPLCSQANPQWLAPSQNTGVNHSIPDAQEDPDGNPLLEQMFRRLVKQGEHINPADLSLEEALAYAEVESFLNLIPLIDSSGRSLWDSFSQYLSEVAQIKILAASLPEESTDSIDLFSTLHRINSAKQIFSSRWQAFAFVFFVRHPKTAEGMENIFSHSSRNNEALRVLAGRYPEFKSFYEQSLLPDAISLHDLEGRSKEVLRRQLTLDPTIAKFLIRHWHMHLLPIADELFDWALDIPAEEDIDFRSLREQYGKGQYIYEGTQYAFIRIMIDALSLGPVDVFYDLGAGYGRVCLYIGMVSPVGRVRGIEIASERAKKARESIKNFKLNHVDILEGDVRLADLSDGTVFYLFNPFHDQTLKQVVQKLQELAESKRFRIVAYGRRCRIYLEDQRWLRVWKQLGAFYDPITIFVTTPIQAPVPNLEKAL